MKVLITGGSSFLGLRLCKRVLDVGELVGHDGVTRKVAKVVLVLGHGTEAIGLGLEKDERISVVAGNLTDSALCRDLVDEDGMVVFHLASVVGDHAEEDFDLCWKVNVEGTRNLLEACRGRRNSKLVYAASGGGCLREEPPGPQPDSTRLLPQTSEGMTAACVELMVNEYSRRGFLDGRSARLPIVIPGMEASSQLLATLTAAIREPLLGRDVVLPMKPDSPHAICGFRVLIRNLLHLAQLPPAAFSGSVSRSVSMPALRLTLEDLRLGLESVAPPGCKLGNVTYVTYAAWGDFSKILSSVPINTDVVRARALGMMGDSSAASIVVDFASECMDGVPLKPELEVSEEPRHCLALSNGFVRVFQSDAPPGDKVLVHTHRVDSLFFFLSTCSFHNTPVPSVGPPPFASVKSGQVLYAPYSERPFAHKVKIGDTSLVCLCVELHAERTPRSGEPPAKRHCSGAPGSLEGGQLPLVMECPKARVYTLEVQPGCCWEGRLPYTQMLWIVHRGAQVTGGLGDRLLVPSEAMFREGPLDLAVRVVGRERLALWVVELT